jgi:hypothetical protein
MLVKFHPGFTGFSWSRHNGTRNFKNTRNLAVDKHLAARLRCY